MHVLYSFMVSVFFATLTAFPAFADVAATSSNATSSDADYIFYLESQDSGISQPGEISALSDAPASLSLSEEQFANCVYYDVTISGTDYILLLPSAYESLVWVDSSGYLWNMSTSSIQGRLFQNSFDPLAETGKLLYMQPCLGNNFSNNRNYGSPNYIRNYYYSGSQLTYSTDYVMVHVEQSHHLYKSSDLSVYVIIFLVGCCLICLWKKSWR